MKREFFQEKDFGCHTAEGQAMGLPVSIYLKLVLAGKHFMIAGIL